MKDISIECKFKLPPVFEMTIYESEICSLQFKKRLVQDNEMRLKITWSSRLKIEVMGMHPAV